MSIPETSATHRRLWFVRREGTVRGPFPTPLIKRYLILKRLKPTDELSLDQQLWQPVSLYPMFAADRLAEDSALLLAREDERSSGDRRASEQADNPHTERRSGTDRRAAESAESLERRERRTRVVASLKPAQESHRVAAMIAVLLLGIVVSGFLFRPGGPVSEPICVAPPRPAVNWSNCRKEKADLDGVDLRDALLRNGHFAAVRLAGANLAGSDLAYADLSGADLRDSDLRGATATGANLHNAALNDANLENADLSYVDLSQARLDGAALRGAKLGNAIWIDGTSCAPASIGKCAAR